jgi:galactokinase
MAINRHTTIVFERSKDVSAISSNFAGEVRFGLPVIDAQAVQPAWGRYIAGVAAAMSERHMALRGFTCTITTDVPIGGGLSSSAALEVAAALAFGIDTGINTGIDTDVATIAAVCRRAEHLATNVPCGIMDQLTSLSGVKDHALLIDCHSLDVTPIRIPESLAVWVVEISSRTLDGSEYPTRVAQCAVAEREIGPLRLADVQSANRIVDPIVRARARHVVTENERVRQFAAALAASDLRTAGQLMVESHASLRDDFATSTTQMDAAVEHYSQMPGVYGVRMTGGGFGGCIVVLADADINADVDDDAAIDTATNGMRVHAADGASLTTPLS